MKKSFLIMLSGLFILLACIAFPTSASADTTTSASGTTNECKWSLNSERLVIEPLDGKSGKFSDWSDIQSKVPDYLTTIYSVSFKKGVILDSTHLDFKGWQRLHIVDLSGLDTSKLTDMSSMFEECENLDTLNLSGVNASNVTNMSRMFFRCNSLKSLDLSGLDTSHVTDMSYMFYNIGCNSLDLSSLDTSKVTNMSYMFRDTYLTSLDLSKFNTSKVTNMSSMFEQTNLTSIDLSNFDTSSVTDMSFMFSSSQRLASIDLSSFDTSKVAKMRDMFSSTFSLRTIYASTKFIINTSSTKSMFSYCKDLTGGNGTKYDASLVNASPADYAKIDVKDQPGLFTCVHERGLQKIEGTDISDGKDGVITHYTCPVCNLLYKDPAGKTDPLDESAFIKHDPSELSYSWNLQDGYALCSASLTCKNDASHTLKETIKVEDSDENGYEIVKSPTCTNTGLAKYTVKFKNPNFMDQTKEKELEKVSHISVDMPYVPATCAKPGSSGGTKCSVCGEILMPPMILTVPHTPGEAVKENVKAATCSEEGSYDEVIYCEVCHKQLKKVEKTIDKLNHTPGETKNIIITKPTCTSKGRSKDVTFCSVCGEQILSTIKFHDLDKLPHTEVTLSPETPPTCTTDGRTASTKCSVCGMIVKYSETIPATGHNYKNEKVITIEPTCTNTGSYDIKKVCTVCRYSYVYSKAHLIDKLDHTPGEVQKKVIKEPTCITSGSREEKTYCTICNHLIKSHTELIPALGHKPKYGNTTLATFTQDGETAWKCTNKGCNVIGVHILYRLSKVTLNNTTVTYNAKAQKPSVTVTTRDGKKLSASYYTVSYKNNTNIGTATVTITFKNGYKATTKKTFKIVAPKIAKVSIYTPKAEKKALTAKWKKISGISGYEIMTAQNAKFSKRKKTTKASSNVTSVKVNKLSSKKTYYVKVRGYKKVGTKTFYGSWSSVKKIKVK